MKRRRRGFSHPIGQLLLPDKLTDERLLHYYHFLRYSISEKNRRIATQKLIMVHIRLGSAIVAKYAVNHIKLVDDMMSVMLENLAIGVKRISLGALDKHKGTPNITGYLGKTIEGAIRRFISREKRKIKFERISLNKSVGSNGTNGLYEILQKSIHSEQERVIMALRVEGYSDSEIGKEIDLTSERVRQIRLQVAKRFKEICNG